MQPSALAAMAPRTRRRIALWLGAVSCMATCTGIAALAGFDGAPGAISTSPSRWPESSRIVRPDGKPQLLVFVHPQCSCTRATIVELSRLVAADGGRAAAIALVVSRAGSDAREASRALPATLALPGSQVVWDDGGREARRFGALTSGLTLLYDAAGLLRFRGGVTASRGHEGDNPGLEELRAALDGAASGLNGNRPVRVSRVFGCALAADRQPAWFTRNPWK